MNYRVTIKDIARRAGVSPATVSNVLNEKNERVSRATKDKVMRIVRETGYRSNTFARESAGTQSDTIGLITSSLTSPLFAHAIAGVHDAANRFGYHILLCNSRGREQTEADAATFLIKQRVAGIVFISSSSYRTFQAMVLAQKANIPFVVINRLTPVENGFHITIENRRGTYEATQHLIELGHHNIAFLHLPIEGPKGTVAAQERFVGFQQAISDYNVPLSEFVFPGVLGEKNAAAVGYKAILHMFSQSSPPSAVICGSDYLAFGALHALDELGLNVPEDVAVIGHDNTPAASYVKPALSSIHQPMEEAGMKAIETLLRHVWRGEPLHGFTSLPCQLMIRSSSSQLVYA